MQQFRDWLMGWHGIDSQQFIERIPAINGPKQPPRLAKRSADSNRMGLAIFMTDHHTTTYKKACCDINRTA